MFLHKWQTTSNYKAVKYVSLLNPCLIMLVNSCLKKDIYFIYLTLPSMGYSEYFHTFSKYDLPMPKRWTILKWCIWVNQKCMQKFTTMSILGKIWRHKWPKAIDIITLLNFLLRKGLILRIQIKVHCKSLVVLNYKNLI